MIKTNSTDIVEPVGKLKELSADERTRMLYEAREMARRDIVSMTNEAIKQAMFVVAWNMIADGELIDKIIRYTCLTPKEIEGLTERPPGIVKALGVLKELSADERTRMLHESD